MGLDSTFYGNTILEWLQAAGIVVVVLVVAKALYWLSTNVLRRVTAKTQTRLDDIVIDMGEEPIVFGLGVAGVWYALQTLNLSEGASRVVGHLLQFVIVMSVAWLAVRLVDSLYREYLLPLASKTDTDLDDQLLPIVSKGTKLAIWAVGFIVALNNAGYDVGALIAGLGIGGLALAMAAKDTVANIFGGFTIFADRPFVLNDRIKVAGFDGMVREIGVRSTRLETLEGRIVTIPNSTFADSAVENVSAEPRRKVVSNLGLTYDTTPEQLQRAMDLLKEIAAANDGAEDDVLLSFNEFGASALNILFIYYIRKDADILGTMSAMNMEILTRFNAAGLDFAFPTETHYVKQGG